MGIDFRERGFIAIMLQWPMYWVGLGALVLGAVIIGREVRWPWRIGLSYHGVCWQRWNPQLEDWLRDAHHNNE